MADVALVRRTILVNEVATVAVGADPTHGGVASARRPRDQDVFDPSRTDVGCELTRGGCRHLAGEAPNREVFAARGQDALADLSRVLGRLDAAAERDGRGPDGRVGPGRDVAVPAGMLGRSLRRRLV